MIILKKLKNLIPFIFIITTVLAGEIIPADDPNIQYFGRWDFSDPKAPTHSWPGNYIQIEFTGTSISVRLNDDLCYYNVYIDSELHSIFHNSENGNVTKELVSGLEDTQHTLLLSKRNETPWSKYTFLGFELNDGEILLSPEPKPKLKIEFIGDSFTSAAGNEAPSEEAPTPMQAFTNIDKGFGPIVAKNYGAQYHISSICGIGLTLDWQGIYTYNMRDYFDRGLASQDEPKWDFEQWQPNLVVIALGLNDYSGYGGYQNDIQEEETAEYIASYHEFIGTIRDYYPGVKILAVAPHVEWIRNCIKDVVETENNEGREDIFYAQYSYYNGGYVNNGHPDVATHAGIAEELIAAIDTIDAFSTYLDTIAPVFEKIPETPFTSYEKEVEIKLTTDSYSTVKYSLEDKSWDEMEYTFDETGKRDHSTIFIGDHDQEYTLFIRGEDAAGNEMQNSLQFNFNIDTSKVELNWFDPLFDDSSWEMDFAAFGFGTSKDINIELTPSKTTYFRKTFDMENRDDYFGLGFLLQGIGGSVIYLNGREVGRFNLPEDDDIIYDTKCTNNNYSQKMLMIELYSGYEHVITGENIITVEMHAVHDDFSELFFNTQLINNRSEIIFPLNSEWTYYSQQKSPESQIVDQSSLAIDEDLILHSMSFSLKPNYPNPFNPSTMINYQLPIKSEVDLSIYNMLGEKVTTLVSEKQTAGNYNIKWYAENYPSGIYLYKLVSNGITEVRKCVLLR